MGSNSQVDEGRIGAGGEGRGGEGWVGAMWGFLASIRMELGDEEEEGEEPFLDAVEAV
jgi:hypothetical protein